MDKEADVKAPLPAQTALQVQIPNKIDSIIAETPRTPTASPLSDLASTRNPHASQAHGVSSQESDRFMAIRNYLGKDPEQYESSTKSLNKRKLELMNRISSTVFRLLGRYDEAELMKTEASLMVKLKANPKISSALRGTTFLELCMRLFGAGSREEVQERAIRTALSLEQFLRAIIAAAISDWVLDEGRVDVCHQLHSKPEVSQHYERCIAEGESMLGPLDHANSRSIPRAP